MYEQLKERFAQTFGKAPDYIFSAPGRTELGGNHTDHQHGKVLAAAVDRETLAAVAPNSSHTVNLLSEGFPTYHIDLSDLTVHPEEEGKTSALIRGVAAKFREYGLKGFDAYVTSNVLSGSGLSSSAAFEVLIGVIFNHLCGANKTPVEIAQIGQFAENVYFGKPCGLMDQTASSVGSIIAIDFADPADPLVTPIPFDFSACGHSLCIIDTGASHADLTDEYAAITQELKEVCRVFHKEYLRDVTEEEFYGSLPQVRKTAGDRAVLRAVHVFEENKRVEKQKEALLAGDFEAFLKLVTESGNASWKYLQNVIPVGRTQNQEVAYALAVAQHLLGNRGACRVHGGGFAGTIQAFVPSDMVASFRAAMEQAIGEGSCHIMSIRKEGGILVEERK